MKAEDYYKNIKSKWEVDYPSSNNMDDIWSFYIECGYKDPKATLRSLLDQVNWSKNRVLDFGCDNGLMLNFICTDYPEVAGAGVDINASAITKAQQTFPAYEFKTFNGFKRKRRSDTPVLDFL